VSEAVAKRRPGLALLPVSLSYSLTLKIVAVLSSDTLVIYQNIRPSSCICNDLCNVLSVFRVVR
jgi:hypothetical protein